MIFAATSLPGVHVLDVEMRSDDRGFFARTWCRREFAERRLPTDWPQNSVSFNSKKGTLRGMHYQRAPHEEAKLVRCTRGSVYDVVVDVQPESPTFKQWFAVELSADNHRAVFIPKGFAHGFLTLTDDAELYYQISEFHQPKAALGFRWNDPAFGIAWPAAVQVMSARDASYPDFAP